MLLLETHFPFVPALLYKKCHFCEKQTSGAMETYLFINLMTFNAYFKSVKKKKFLYTEKRIIMMVISHHYVCVSFC